VYVYVYVYVCVLCCAVSVFVQVKWYKSKHEVIGDGEETASDDNSSRKRPRKDGNHANSMLFKTGALISIIGEGGEAMAHGVMEDAEPDVSHQKRCQQYGNGIGYWRRISLTSVVRGWANTVLEVFPPFYRIHFHYHHTAFSLSSLLRDQLESLLTLPPTHTGGHVLR
jgi:hypothetical protein